MIYGRYSVCKSCVSKQRKERYKTDSDYADHCKKRAKICRASNKEKYYKTKRKYVLKYPEKRRAYSKKYSSKIINEVSDSYIRFLISRKLNILQREVPDNLIELYRNNLILKRLVKRLPTSKEFYNYGTRK